MKHWLKNLAEARYRDGSWQLEDSESSKLAATAELSDMITNMHLELDEAVLVFNTYRKDAQKISLLPIEQSGMVVGIMLLLGCAQIRLTKTNNRLEETMTVIKNYKKTQLKLAEYNAVFDHFGGLYWQSRRDSTMTYMSQNQLIRVLLQDLCKAQSMIQERGSS